MIEKKDEELQNRIEHYLFFTERLLEEIEGRFKEVREGVKFLKIQNQPFSVLEEDKYVKKVDQIKEFIFKAEDPFTTSDIKDLLGYSQTYIGSYLKKFVEDGSLEIIGNKKTSSKGKLSNVYRVIDREYFNPNPSVEYLLKKGKLHPYRDSESEFEHSEK